MLTNRKLSAADAAQWGLVNDVVDDAELGAKVDALAGEIASGAKGSNAAVKKLLLATFDNGIEAQMDTREPADRRERRRRRRPRGHRRVPEQARADQLCELRRKCSSAGNVAGGHLVGVLRCGAA